MKVKSEFNFAFLWGQLILGAGLEVRMVEKQVTVILDQVVVLGCSFIRTSESPLENIIVTWQRIETNDVVHCYYYGEDQLSKQSPQYSGRTSLFPAELKNGNASLRLKGVSPADTGKYMCYVSSTIGSDYGTISVQFAAYYNEPVLFFKQQLSSTILMFESQGYPKADVAWYNGDNLDVSFLSKCFYQQTANALYIVQSTLEINITERSSNYTFVLRNAAVNQTISRRCSFLIIENTKQIQEVFCNYYVALLSCILGPIFIIIIIMALAMIHKLRYIKPKEMYINPGQP